MTEAYEQFGFKNLTPEELQLFNRFGEDYKSATDILYRTRELAFEMTCANAKIRGKSIDSPDFHILSELYHSRVPKMVLRRLNEGESIDDILEDKKSVDEFIKLEESVLKQ